MIDYKARRVKRLVESFNDLDKEEQDKVLDTIKYNTMITAAREVSKTRTVTFGDLYEGAKLRHGVFNQFEGFGSGLKFFDDSTMGFREGEVTVIAGPSNFGKTMLAVNVIVSVVEKSLKKALVISMEMTDKAIADRIYHMSDTHEPLKENIIIQTELSVSAKHIKAMIERHKPDIVLIDHLQFLAKQEQGTEYERVNAAIAKVKRLSIHFRLPIIIVSHVAKTRSGKNGEATTADLKGSSSIEQDSDIVIMVNRPSDSNGGANILTLSKHRTKYPDIFNKDCLIRIDGVRIVNNGEYTLYD